MGIDKLEPYNERQQIEKIIKNMLGKTFTNTAHKFRFRQLSSRFNTYKQYWNRILRKIDDGTYERDKFMMAHRDKTKVDEETSPEEKKEEKAKKKEIDEDDIIQSLYNGFLEAKKKCKENTGDLYFNDFKKMIIQQQNNIKKKYKCKEVDFRIVIDKGKPKLKATPK